MLPLLLGVVPFSVVYSVAARQAGLSYLDTVLMSLIVFAGASQFIAVTLFGAGSSPILIVLITLLVNSRHLLFGVSLSPFLRQLNSKLQGLLAFILTDEVFAVTIAHHTRASPSYRYQLGAGLALYAAWNITTAISAALSFPLSISFASVLRFIVPASFLALLVPMVRKRTDVVVGLSSGVAALILVPYLKGGAYILPASLIGMIVGGLLSFLWKSR